MQEHRPWRDTLSKSIPARPAAAMRRFYCDFGAWFANKRAVRQGVIDPLSESDRDAMPQFSLESLTRALPFGKPAEVISRLRRYEDLGYDEYSLWLDNGMTHESKRVMLSRFMDEVMPAFA